MQNSLQFYTTGAVPENELQHYGVLGMKWGVRRYQPYPDGKDGHFVGERTETKHRKLTTTEKWKDHQKFKIDKMYDKTYRRLDKLEKEHPKDPTIDDYRKQLEKQHAQDLKSISDMTFGQVEEARKQEAVEAKERTKANIKTAGNALMWGAKMSLIGVRLGGTAAVLAAIANGGNQLFSYLGSEEGMEAIKTGVGVLKKLGDSELSIAQAFQNYAINSLPDSAFKQNVASIDFTPMLPAAKQLANGDTGDAARTAVNTALKSKTAKEMGDRALDDLKRRL